MKLQDIYKYSWFANLAYVLWVESEIGGTEENAKQAIEAANNEERIPGDRLGTGATLGERIFLDPTANGGGLGWRLINYSDQSSPTTASTGFSTTKRGQIYFLSDPEIHLSVARWLGK
ncbi:MAG: hypothetical protein HY943_05300 [Gammaproteobacteria bacterium]|nr:hypothetical protein [Gammaproteobacteria bacterium]